MLRLTWGLRIAALAGMPLMLSACVVAPPPPPGPVVVAPRPVGPPPPVYVAPPPARRCWVESRRVWTRDQFGRPVQVVQQQQVCR